MASLGSLQKTFALALLDRTRPVPAGIRSSVGSSVERRFAVYRNNVFVGLTEALAIRFPVCVALVGGEFFREMARLYTEVSPPRSPLLMAYGDDFGDFVDSFPPAARVPYLGDIARLEAARTRAYHAADAKPLKVEALASLSSCAWGQARVELHPSVEVVRSAYPIVTIWNAHNGGAERGPIDGSVPEDALIARPDVEVEIYELPAGGAAFLSCLLRGATFREAADYGESADPDFDLVTNLTGLMTHRVIVGLSSPGFRPALGD